MESINKIKVKLEKYFNSQIDRTSVKPVRIFAKKGFYYLILEKKDSNNTFLTARSLDGFDFDLEENPSKLEDFNPKFGSYSIVSKYALKEQKIMYKGEKHIYLGKLSKNKKWSIGKKSLIPSVFPTEVGGAFLFSEGIILLYFEKIIKNNTTVYRANIAEFDKNNPENLVWKNENPVWNSEEQWPDKEVKLLGSVLIKNTIIMYFYVDSEVIYGVHLSGFLFDPKFIKVNAKLKKHVKNPIIQPKPKNSWEAFNTLNPAAVYLNKKVHILYRAQGYDYLSTFGYAVSSDGVNIDHRLDYPVYGPRAKFETNTTGSVNPLLTSGGGYGGCEDPRITLLDDRLYLTYVAFDGWTNLRLALTSISVFDFLSKRWNWEKPVLISPPHVIDKSGCLFPEKINGKYVFLHRVFPNILIDFVGDLNFHDEKWITGQYKIKVRPNKWDSRKIGAGAPPLKTKDGWLLIYYGVNDKDASKYHIGAMLLDLNNPAKVLYRSDKPILSPTEHYENNGFKPGIAYPCGAVIIKNELFVYYGAADSTVCVAKADLDYFLSQLKKNKDPKIKPIEIREIDY